MTSRPPPASVSYTESFESNIPTYRCSVTFEKPFLQTTSQTDKYTTGAHFEELKVFRRAPPTISTSMTIAHSENGSPTTEHGAVRPAQYGIPFYRKGAQNPGLDDLSYQNQRQVATSVAGHDLPQVSQNVNISLKNIGKPASQPAIYWKTSLASQSYEPQADDRQLPGNSDQYLVETDDEGILKVFTVLNENHLQNEEELSLRPCETTGIEHQPNSQVSRATHQLRNTSYDLYELSDCGSEMTKQRKLPDISTFREFWSSYKFGNTPRNGQIDQCDITPPQSQRRGYSCKTAYEWSSMTNKEITNRGDVTPQKPQMAARESTFYRGNTDSAEDNSQQMGQYCGKASNQVNGPKCQGKIQDHRKHKYRCSVCWKSFSQTANLKAHTRIHTGEKPFGCQVCHRRFSQRSSVKTHMRIHSGERPFSCTFCKKSFYDSSTLIKHRRIHTGEKPYLCKICHQRFSQSGNLTRHYKLHMTKTF